MLFLSKHFLYNLCLFLLTLTMGSVSAQALELRQLIASVIDRESAHSHHGHLEERKSSCILTKLRLQSRQCYYVSLRVQLVYSNDHSVTFTSNAYFDFNQLPLKDGRVPISIASLQERPWSRIEASYADGVFKISTLFGLPFDSQEGLLSIAEVETDPALSTLGRVVFTEQSVVGGKAEQMKFQIVCEPTPSS